MDTKGMSMLSNEYYQEWKKMMMSNLMDLGYDVWNWVRNGYTKILSWGEEVQKNNKAWSDIINSIHGLTLKRIMHYTIVKDVWIIYRKSMKEKQYYSSRESTGKLVPKENNDVSKCEYVMSDGVTDLEEDKLEEILNLKRKLDFALEGINIIKDKLHTYDNRDHVKLVNVTVVSKQYYEGLEAEIVSLRADLENSNKWNEELLQVFENNRMSWNKRFSN